MINSQIGIDFSELDDLQDIISKYEKNVSEENITNALKKGATLFQKDLLKLTKPRREVKKAGYTHMVDCFQLKTNGKNVDVGWGKYYGFFLEKGTKHMNAQPHFEKTFERNKENYFRAIVSALNMED